MKVHFDEKADAIYLKLNDVKIIDSEEVTPGVILDFDKDDQVVGIELLQMKKRVPLSELKQLQFEVA
ncbi:MAG: DUF2283 domain-containing protein [Desulfuromusa sp.]